MSEQDRHGWDDKYSAKPLALKLAPNVWLAEHVGSRPVGKALDLACGQGHNAVFLAQQGFEVTAVDISPVGLQQARRLAEHYSVLVKWMEEDLDQWQTADHFDLVCCTYFLDRGLFARVILPALRPEGVFIAETFTVDQLERTAHKPRRDYLLERGELLELCQPLQVRAYREAITPNGAVASIVSVK